MTSRNRSLLIVLFILIAITIGYFLAWPAAQNLKNVNSQVAATQADIDLSNQKITDLREFAQLLQKYPTEAQLVDLAAPADFDLPQYMIQVEAIAAKSGVTLTSIQPPPAGVKIVDVQISGGYDGILAFVVNLEKNLRSVKVSKINLASALTEGGAIISATLTTEPLTIAQTQTTGQNSPTEVQSGATQTDTSNTSSSTGLQSIGSQSQSTSAEANK